MVGIENLILTLFSKVFVTQMFLQKWKRAFSVTHNFLVMHEFKLE
jgi:hypothetical protein